MLCGGAGPTLANIVHNDDCPMGDLAIVNVSVTPRTGIVTFTQYEHYRWSWWSASGVRYHVAVQGKEFMLVLAGVDGDIMAAAERLSDLRTWIEQNQGVL